MTSRLTPYQHQTCPSCGDALRPVVYGLPGGDLIAAADRGEVILGGCIVGAADTGCPTCGWQDEQEDDALTAFVDAGDLYDTLPTDTDELAGLTISQAAELEASADSVSALAALADGLLVALRRTTIDDRLLVPAERFATTVGAAADRAAEAADTARRAIGRVLDLADTITDEDDESNDDWLYEKVLTARLHVPIATSLLSDALADATPALRHLARLTLAASLDGDGDRRLERHARGVLRLDLTGLDEPSLVAEQPELWSVTLDELRLELAGLLANMLVDHRCYLILSHEGRANRFVQVLTFDRGLHVESVGDKFLSDDEKLSQIERERLATLGWEPPDGEPPNWTATWTHHVDVLTVAGMLVDTLVSVHGLESLDEIALTIHESVDPFDTSPEST